MAENNRFAQVSNETKRFIFNWAALCQNASESSDENLIKAAIDFTSELSIDSPVAVLVDELCERIEVCGIMNEIANERKCQDGKWGEQNHDDLYWLGILMEEVGEAAKNIIEHKPVELIRSELIQCAAVIVAWIECMDRRIE